MVFHVGLYPFYGMFSYQKESEKSFVDVKVADVESNETEKVSLIIDKIKFKAKEKLGCLCVCLDPYYGNEIRKRFIESGLQSGFQNVEIINLQTSIYLFTMPQIKYRPLNGNIIWIQWDNHFYVWKICDQKAKYGGKWFVNFSYRVDLNEAMKESKLNRPDVVLYNTYIGEGTIGEIPACHYVSYERHGRWHSRGSLIKAIQKSGNQELAHLEIGSYLSEDISIKVGNIELASLKFGQKLPFIHSQVVIKTMNDADVEIKAQHAETELFKMPNYDETLVTILIDVNRIFIVTFEEMLWIPEKEQLENTNISDTKKIVTKTKIRNNHFSPKLYKIPTIVFPYNTAMNLSGIDLGTSRCCAAVNKKNGIITIPLDNTGERLLPSYVSYAEEDVQCGKIVVERLRNFSKSTVFDSKRLIGRNINNIHIDSFWPFGIVETEGKVYLEVQKFNGKGMVSPEEIAAHLLKHVKQKLEESHEIKLSEAVITVPATFTDIQKNATIEAAKFAGWKNVVLLPEPIAAAFAYFNEQPIPNNSTVLLFDLGGGTLDVCIFNVKNDEIEIISNTGDNKLGGRDFDTVLINYFKNALLTKYGISLIKNKKYLLMVKCQSI